MPKIQEAIYQLEEGSFGRIFQIIVLVVGIAVLAIIFHLREFSNLAHPSAMDMAQVGRNLAQGEGFTTKNVRPFGMYMVDRLERKKNQSSVSESESSETSMFPVSSEMLAKDRFPDLSHPPLYPALLSVAFNILPFDWDIDLNEREVFLNNSFRYQPDVIISFIQTLLLISAVALTYLVALQLFDARVAWLSALVMLLHNYFWGAIFSGLPTLLLVNLTLVLGFFVSVLIGKWENLSEELAGIPAGSPLDLKEDFFHSLILISLSGITIGIGGLIDYCYLWLLAPLIAITCACSPRWRFLLGVVPLILAALIMAPWFLRNMGLTGNPFGLAGYSVFQSTQIFPYNTLDMNLTLDTNNFAIGLIAKKFMLGVQPAINEAIESAGGLIVVSFFIVGLFLPFRSQKLNRVRYWVGSTAILLILVSAVVKVNYFTTDSHITPYQLSAWLSPFMVIFAVACFFVVTDQIELQNLPMRRAFPILFILLSSMPLIWKAMPPNRYGALPMLEIPGRISAAESPIFPYDIFNIQRYGNYFRPSISKEDLKKHGDNPVPPSEQGEIIMSDMPWAWAWYGNRSSFLMTSKFENEYVIHLTVKRIQGLFLTQMTMLKSFDEIFSLPNAGWASFLREVLLKEEVPSDFHLMFTPNPIVAQTKEGFPILANQFFLTSFVRWDAPDN